MIPHPSEETLALHLSRDLDPAQSADILGHLDSCEPCRAKFEQLQTMQSMLIEASPEPLEEDVQAVRQALQRKISGLRVESPRQWIWNGAAATAACIVVALLLFNVHPEKRPRLTSPAPLRLNVPVIVQREIADVSLPPKYHNRRTPQVHLLAGIRSVSWNVEQDGTSQLRIATQDPNVLILLPMPNAGDKHEN